MKGKCTFFMSVLVATCIQVNFGQDSQPETMISTKMSAGGRKKDFVWKNITLTDDDKVQCNYLYFLCIIYHYITIIHHFTTYYAIKTWKKIILH